MLTRCPIRMQMRNVLQGSDGAQPSTAIECGTIGSHDTHQYHGADPRTSRKTRTRKQIVVQVSDLKVNSKIRKIFLDSGLTFVRYACTIYTYTTTGVQNEDAPTETVPR